MADFNSDYEEIKEVQGRIEDTDNKAMDASNMKEMLYEKKNIKLEKAKLQSSNKLTDKELAFLKKTFDEKTWEKTAEKPNFEELDKILTRLKFFQGLSFLVRVDFYRHAKYIKLPKSTEIYKYGDTGDLMYVILRGNYFLRRSANKCNRSMHS